MAHSAENEGNGRMPDAARAEQRYRDLIELLPAVIYEAELGEGEWYYVSSHVQEMLGYRPEEIIANPELWGSRLHPDDRNEVLELERTEAAMARSTDVRLVSEYRMLHRDGHIVWVRDEARLVEREGRTPFWRGVFINITEERIAQQALAESHERYRGLVNSLPVCAYEADPGSEPGRQFVSPQVRELLGYTPEEWAADPSLWESTLHATDRSRVLRDAERHLTMAVGTPWVSEYRLLKRSGAVIWVRDRAVVAEGRDGRRVIDGILTDVTPEHGKPGTAHDVLRVTCAACGAAHAAERAGPCVACGSGDVVTISLNATLAELAGARAQIEALLDGVHQHLEAVSGTGDRAAHIQRPMPPVERRIMTRPTSPRG